MASGADGSTTNGAMTPNPVIRLAANAMSLIKPIFAAEAYLQAAILGAIANVDKDSGEQNTVHNQRMPAQ